MQTGTDLGHPTHCPDRYSALPEHLPESLISFDPPRLWGGERKIGSSEVEEGRGDKEVDIGPTHFPEK